MGKSGVIVQTIYQFKDPSVNHKIALYQIEHSNSSKKNESRQIFFSKSGVSEINRHLKSMHFDEKIYTQTMKPGTKFYRYSEVGQTSGKHYFSTKTEFFPGEVGKCQCMESPLW